MQDNVINAVFRYLSGVAVLVWICFSATPAQGQDAESVYYKNYVRHADGSQCQHAPPHASFTAYINNDQRKILIDNAPRWDTETGSNFDATTGTFGVELQNFTEPSLEVGDSIAVRFTCIAYSQQATLRDTLPSIPWPRFPSTLTLEEKDIPAAPGNVSLTLNTSNERVLEWDTESGLTYSVYRRTVQDTIFNGQSRKLYTRVNTDLNTNTFTDTTTTDSVLFGYIVYAQNSSGILGAHSSEIIETRSITNIQVQNRTPTTVSVSWDSFTAPIGETVGYNIYRRLPGGEFGEPIAYTGLNPSYSDTRLQPGTQYEYLIRARVDAQTEFGESQVLSVTTLAAQDGYYIYANLKGAVVIYKNTNDPFKIPDSEVADIQELLQYTRDFYWRNSGMKLNIEWDFYPIDEYKEFGDGTQVQTTARHLADMGIMNTQYDMIFRITPATTGLWSVGAPVLDLPDPRVSDGDKRRTGFCQVHWPKYSGAGYPYVFEDIETPPAVIWTAEHENQHVIDAVYRWNNHEEMPHGDRPQEFGPENQHGRHWSFQSKMFRYFDYYEDLLPEWGDIYETIDADNDGFPDADDRVTLDESRFGSSADNVDTDGDGLTDKAEATDGIYHYSLADPNNQDTDEDGTPDGEDVLPRYPVHQTIREFTPVIDGEIEAGWPMVNDTIYYSTSSRGYSPKWYMSYNADSLYFALDLPDVGVPYLFFDFGADSRYWGRGNTEMEFNLTNGTIATLRSWDGTQEARDYQQELDPDVNWPSGFWDTNNSYVQHFGRRVLTEYMINLNINLDLPRIRIEMAIPKNEWGDLTLQPGDSIGVLLNYDKVNDEPGAWANTFDEHSFVYFTFEGEVGTSEEKSAGIVPEFELEQNYPNPFNGETLIRYSIPEPGLTTVKIYDVRGNLVKTVGRLHQNTGQHAYRWNAQNEAGKPAPSGVYFYRLENGSKTATGKMVLIR